MEKKREKQEKNQENLPHADYFFDTISLSPSMAMCSASSSVKGKVVSLKTDAGTVRYLVPARSES